ncbi:hypothetical protein GWI33_010776 [Rhynchophorus ferrugineus]|uniref:Uncharacterized protein n=1 Tax=Rhynchophorus ferrugineus TaxID=354439 RepID=A0A834IQI5_RHYFE|nr:hypothetical protein GWI33_010776 [Rhynchophorus ferrugineus]
MPPFRWGRSRKIPEKYCPRRWKLYLRKNFLFVLLHRRTLALSKKPSTNVAATFSPDRKIKPKSVIMKRLLGTRFFTRLLLLVCSLSLLSILLLSKCGLESLKYPNAEDSNEDVPASELSGKLKFVN